MMRLFARVMLAMCLAVAAGFNVQAQTRPKVTSLGPDFPKAALFVGSDTVPTTPPASEVSGASALPPSLLPAQPFANVMLISRVPGGKTH